MNKTDPQNTNAKGNSWADGKGKKQRNKNLSYKWKKQSKPTYLWKALYSASLMQWGFFRFLYAIISFSTTTTALVF